jgi:hypothetical protein
VKLEPDSLYGADFEHEKGVFGIPPAALANRHFIPGQGWRQAYGRQKEEFLLKFASRVDGRCKEAVAWSP